MQGIIASYSSTGGFGFIVSEDASQHGAENPSANKVFFRIEAVTPVVRASLFEGQKVDYEMSDQTEDMWPVAKTVTPVEFDENDWEESEAWSSYK